MIISFNRYNGGGGSGSGVTPQEVQAQIDSALTPYWESGETKDYTDAAISAATSLYTPTSGFSTINGSAITNGGDIVIQGGGGNIVELTQQEYDNLSAYSPDTLYVISDATPINMDNYAESGDVATQIAAAVSGKADAVSVSPSDGYQMPEWNSQGVITGYSSYAYPQGTSLNGNTNLGLWAYSTDSFDIYAPTTYGAAGAPLLANGENNAPVWANYKFAVLTQTQYDNLATKDASTIYFIIG